MNESMALTPSRVVANRNRLLQLRARIIHAAAKLMCDRGVAATTISDVAHASGAAVPEVHYHFPDKTQLVLAVIEREVTVVLDGQDGVEAIVAWNDLDTWVSRVIGDHPTEDRPLAGPLGALAAELMKSEHYRPALDAAFRTWEGQLSAGLRRIQERGELDPVANPDRLAASLIAAMQGGYLLAAVHGRIDIIRDVLDDAIAALRRYRV